MIKQMSKAIQLVQQLKVGNSLGEGVIWDHRQQCLYWTDILAKQFYCWNFNGQPSQYPCPKRLCSFGLTQHQGWLIAAFDNGFAFFHPASGQVIP
ncbi:MAG: L-arabinonolactonase, partial [Paraglaciecola sp.]